MKTNPTTPTIAIACGGTGGHLFPGIAVAEELSAQGAAPRLLISEKAIDQLGARTAPQFPVHTLPAVGLTRGHLWKFVASFWRSWRAAQRLFQSHRPQAILAMGGFTSAPPLIRGRLLRCRTFIHEANSIPGRANRHLARWVDEVFIYFNETRDRLHNRHTLRTGMPVRACFQKNSPEAARAALGLNPHLPVLLIMGGSQGATGVNRVVLEAAPMLNRIVPELQFLHLTGSQDEEAARAVYAQLGTAAVVRPFLTEMDLALGAATLAISRAGASSIAEFAAMAVPALLIPYPEAVDDHQRWNAVALARSGAARYLLQKAATPENLIPLIAKCLEVPEREKMIRSLSQWHFPRAAVEIAREILHQAGYSPADAPLHSRPGARSDTQPETGLSREELPELLTP